MDSGVKAENGSDRLLKREWLTFGWSLFSVAVADSGWITIIVVTRNDLPSYKKKEKYCIFLS
jgi:hypothetical protein